VPAPGTAQAAALAVVRGAGRPVFDVVDLHSPDDVARLAEIAG
jgi:hypothetical protein